MKTTDKKKKFDEMLDSSFEPFQMGELIFWPSDIFQNCNPVQYEIELLDWVEE